MHCTNCGAPCYGASQTNNLCPRCKNLKDHGEPMHHVAMKKAGTPQHPPQHALPAAHQRPPAAPGISVHEEPTVPGNVKLMDFPRYRGIHQIIARLKTASDNAEYQNALNELQLRVDVLAREGRGPLDPEVNVPPGFPSAVEPAPVGLAAPPAILAQATAAVPGDHEGNSAPGLPTS